MPPLIHNSIDSIMIVYVTDLVFFLFLDKQNHQHNLKSSKQNSNKG